MTRKIRYTKPVAGEKPAVRIEFAGAALNDYFSLRRIATEDFGISQTTLGRKIIREWLGRYRAAVNAGQTSLVRQLTLALELGNNKLRLPGNKAAEKKEVSK